MSQYYSINVSKSCPLNLFFITGKQLLKSLLAPYTLNMYQNYFFTAISKTGFVQTWVIVLFQMNDAKRKNPICILDNVDNTLSRNVVPTDSNDATWIKFITDFSVLQRPRLLLDGFFDTARQNSADNNLAKSQTYRRELAKIDAWNDQWRRILGSRSWKMYNFLATFKELGRQVLKATPWIGRSAARIQAKVYLYSGNLINDDLKKETSKYRTFRSQVFR